MLLGIRQRRVRMAGAMLGLGKTTRTELQEARMTATGSTAACDCWWRSHVAPGARPHANRHPGNCEASRRLRQIRHGGCILADPGTSCSFATNVLNSTPRRRALRDSFDSAAYEQVKITPIPSLK